MSAPWKDGPSTPLGTALGRLPSLYHGIPPLLPTALSNSCGHFCAAMVPGGRDLTAVSLHSWLAAGQTVETPHVSAKERKHTQVVNGPSTPPRAPP